MIPTEYHIRVILQADGTYSIIRFGIIYIPYTPPLPDLPPEPTPTPIPDEPIPTDETPDGCRTRLLKAFGL